MLPRLESSVQLIAMLHDGWISVDHGILEAADFVPPFIMLLSRRFSKMTLVGTPHKSKAAVSLLMMKMAEVTLELPCWWLQLAYHNGLKLLL